jgi:DNA-binding transcriptional LysR family regulator
MASDYATQVFVSQLLRVITREATNVTLDLITLDEKPFEALSQGQSDYLIIPRRFTDEAYPMQELFVDTFCAVAWRGNEVIGDVLDLTTYKSLRHIAPVPGHRLSPKVKEYVALDVESSNPIAVTTYDFSTAANMLIGTNLIAVMQRRLAEEFARHLPLRILALPMDMPPIELCIQWHKFQQSDPLHLWLRRLIVQIASNMNS